jgi:hypothetical protein
MIKPFIVDELFELNEELGIAFIDDVIYIDNFYKNYEKIYKLLNNISVPNWKISSESKNFVDYYDCSYTIDTSCCSEKYAHGMIMLGELISKFFKEEKRFVPNSTNCRFNVFKNITYNRSNNLQHFPHIDTVYNVIVYLDKQCSGGTALYPDIERLHNTEHIDLFYDTSKINKKIIQAKPNRLAIFKGEQYHGGYIEDHNAYTGENWRINQVMFFEEYKE